MMRFFLSWAFALLPPKARSVAGLGGLRLMPSSGASVAESGVPGEAAGQQVAGGGELLADEAQAEEPGAHGVLGVVVLLGLGAGGLDRLRHLAEREATPTRVKCCPSAFIEVPLAGFRR